MSDPKMLSHDLTGAKLEAERAIDDVAAYALILGRAEGRAEERAAIVAWLRELRASAGENITTDVSNRMADIAIWIERGEHLRGDDE